MIDQNDKKAFDQWLEICKHAAITAGLSTRPANRPLAEAGCLMAYEAADLAPPKTIYWADSPIAGARLAAEIAGGRVEDHLGRALFGQHDINWLGQLAALNNVVPDPARDLDGLLQVACASGWWWVFDEAAILTERPTLLKRDGEGRLHCEDGPALQYPDGWGVWSWRGTRIPQSWIEEPETLTAEVALTWENIEQRRCAAEILGWDKILTEIGAETINVDPDPEIGTLLRADLPDSPGEQFLRVRCGTGRTFCLPVPPDVTTALQANAWTYGIDPIEFKLEVRT